MKVHRDNRWKSTLDSPKPPLTSKSPSIDPIKSSHSLNTKEYIKIDEYQYAQCDLLGTGYTSKVYLGRMIDNKRKQVAIKTIDLRKISKQKEHLQLLKQEMHIHQQLDHPNIVKCHKIVEKGHYYYFFLQYCPEGTLDSFIKRHQKLAESTAVTIIEQIIAGYKYLLEHKVLHRDLKPPNILKSGYNWKICDFGFSVMGKKHLVGNINVGTPAYMAPQALERTYYSPKTDIFSIGVICYEMLFGKAPWHHKDQQILLTMMQKKISEQTLNSIANWNLVEFIGKCCQPHERRRIGLEQFQQFDFWKKYEPKTTSIKVLEADDENSKATSKTLCTMRDYSLPASSCPSQTTNMSTAKHNKKQATEPAFSINKAIIEEELYICKIILVLMKNYTILLLIDDIQKDLYLTVLVRHSNYMLRRIIHNKFNYLSLKKWEDYSSNQHYLSLVAQASDLTEKISALMKAQTRRKSIITIRIFNKRYDDLTYDKNLSQKCIENMKEYIHQIMINLLKNNESGQNKQAYQTLLYLNKYYKYIKTMPTDDEKSRVVHFNQKEASRESVIMEFRDVVMSEGQFSKLKQEISSIHL